jgi:PKD repeat protein
MRRILVAIIATLLIVAAMPLTAVARIGSSSGNVVEITPPASAIQNTLEDATNVFAWDEQQGVTLASPLRTDIQTPGVYALPADLTLDEIPAGTVVDSHIFHSDRPGPSGGSTGTVLRTFTVTFPTDILGVVATNGKLADSDVLGAPGTAYPAAPRSITFGNDAGRDRLTLTDQRTILAEIRTTSGLDQFRVITTHDAPPTAAAGGPYTGIEGEAVPLTASATDPEGGPLAVTWSVSHTADAGTTCSIADGSTLTPTVTCNDDALVTATLSVDDGVNPPVTSSAQVTIGNAFPAADALAVPATPVPLGTAATASVPFTDDGSNDTHSASVAWGDTTSTTATVTESAGSGTADASHVYAAPGLYTVSMTLSDDDGASVVRTAQITVNGPPSADAGGPYSGSEGLPTALAGTAVDPDGDPLGIAWTFVPGALDAGASCSSTGETTLTPTVTCTDDAVVAADLTADDGVNPAAVSSTTVAVANEAPLLGALAVTSGPIAPGASVSVVAPFTDDGTNDTHVADVDWGDLTTDVATVGESGGTGSVSASHAYASPGIYPVTLTLHDDDLGSDVRTATVVVNSPPTADAGGPYAGLEGAPLALAGTATDADGDPVTITWAFSVAAAPGTVCSPIGAGTLTPTLICNDDAVVTATMTAFDGVNAPVSDTTTIAVGNAAPLVGAAVPSAETVPTSTEVSIGLAWSDDGTNDTHSATIDWGDGAVEPGIVGGSATSGTVSGSHAYATSGSYTVTVTVTDDDGAATIVTTSVLVNGAPTVGAGGPYSGVEGAAVALVGTAADPDADTLLVSWTSNVVASDVGTTCALAGADTLTPSLTCDDDATVDVTLTVADGVNPTVVDTASVVIENADPAVGAPVAVPNPAPLGTPITLFTGFTDPGVNDVHSATIDWDDGAVGAGSVSESSGTGNVNGSHTYSTPGTYTVSVSVSDTDGGTSAATTTVVVNAPPEIDAAGPYAGLEGGPVALAGTATDADGDPLALSWSFATSVDAGGSCTMSGTATLVPSVTCSDDATITATLTADDGVNPPVSDTTTLTVANQAPGIGLVTVPAAPVPIGTSVNALTTFVDAGTNDGHTAVVDWGDGTTSPGVVSEAGGNGSVSGGHAYAAAGTYTVAVTVTDDDGGVVVGTAASRVVVFDGGNGFVIGGGWINSPGNAYTPNDHGDAARTGKAAFGFVARKRSSDPVPTGQTEFQLQLRRGHDDDRRRGRDCDDRRDDGWERDANFHFHSTSYTSLTVNGSTAVFRGTGRVDGQSGYEFLVSVVDGRPTHSADRFRIKIWKTSTGTVLYDNQAGAADTAAATQALSGGSIVVHHS